METVTCDICGSSDTQLVYQVHDTNYGVPGQFHLVQCQRCQLIYLNPRPSEADHSIIYPQASYDPFSNIAKTGEVSRSATQSQRGQQLTQAFGTGRVLDVGCADGLFLQVLRDWGWTCMGIEPNEKAARFARTRLQLDVTQGYIFDVNAWASFDLVTLWDVLEHTPSPRAVLSHAHKLLVSHGVLALSLPNWDSIERLLFRETWIGIDAPRHFYHFAPATITQLLHRCGFKAELMQARAPVLSLASNVLRLGGNWVLRRGRAKTVQELNVPAQGFMSPRRRILIRLIHLSMTPFNTLINLANRGASLTVIARKFPEK